jgi:hypothetical protein
MESRSGGHLALVDWRRTPGHRSRAERERELGARPQTVKLPRWLLYVALGIVAAYLLARTEWVALAVFAGLTLAGLLVQKLAAD